MDDVDELLALGQQILDELVDKYVPTGDGDLALVLFPGQVVPDDLVQQGTTNPVQVSRWLGDLYDFPLELELGDQTSLVTTAQSAPPLRSAYATAARFGVPAVAADDPSRPRIEDLIAKARQAVGNASDTTLGFMLDHEHFAEPTYVWKPFDAVITTHSEQTTTQPGPARPPHHVDPRLWQLRALPETVAEALPERVVQARDRVARAQEWRRMDLPQVRVAREELLRSALVEPTVAEPAVAEPAVTEPAPVDPAVEAVEAGPPVRTLGQARLTRLAGVGGLANLGGLAAQPLGLARDRTAVLQADRPVEVRAGDVPTRTLVQGTRVVRDLDPTLLHDLTTVRLPDLEDAPSTTTVTTADSELHVHLEHLQVTVLREFGSDPWWHPDLLVEPAWYVPGMRTGTLVPAPDGPDRATCQPLTLLLVRNLTLTGTWTSTAADLMSGVHYVGPFLMGGATTDANASAQQTVAMGSGLQVIGMVCGPLAPIPPRDDPALGEAAPGAPG